MKRNILSITVAIALLFSFSKCEKAIEEKKEAAGIDYEMVKATAIVDVSAEIGFNTASVNSALYESYSLDNPIESYENAPCAEVIFETAPDGGFPKTITINYGDSCEVNGIYRSGIVMITLSGYFMSSGTIITMDHQDFMINGWTINGEITWENTTENPEQPRWMRETYGSTYTNPLGITYTHNGYRDIKQVAGYGNLILDDNVYESADGNYTVERDNGNSLNMSVLQPIIKAFNCEFIQSGRLSVQGELLDGIVDYGDGTCDNQALYTHSNGLTFNIDL